ncbi:MAG TPA: chorismate-binding protein [Pyrinomonadaceae bacterium]|nr:chorismate-binding protein [Pyrinomonadaceae bacterium]
MIDFDKFQDLAKHADLVPVAETISADLLTPLAVYLKLSKDAKNSFLLESVEGGETLARYSFIGANPESIVRGDRNAVYEDGERIDGSMLTYLRDHFAGNRVAEIPGLPSFIGGAIGYLGFNCAEWFEPTLRLQCETRTDNAKFMFFRSVVAFDHAKQVVHIITLADTNEVDLRASFEDAAARNRRMRNVLENSPVVLPRRAENAVNGAIASNCTRDRFESGVSEIKELIRAGECYQVVLSQCFSRETNASPVAIYRAVRSLNPSPYMFLLQFDERSIIGASPEMLVRSRGNKLEYRPIAGTRPRGKTPLEDTQLADEMKKDRKEVAEHLMLVDLGRNDLGRVAEFGSVEVNGLMSVEKYSHVQHLVTYLSAKLDGGKDRFDALASCFPAGTVSGAPKVRAIEIINDLEPTARGIYSGCVGYFDYAGNMDTCIAIRTMILENGVAKVQAGAGIVADSVPENEYQETVNKARAMLKAIEIAEGSV